ncbi:MAG: hypothetical protein AVDCRST_MAG67-4139 [uncultured Solirubrobacteraceae bacterium]|uniref:DUF2304 domain-containing protein n=1 Tax=uncultured Solirubrobacteraceae bacterium TaxID=1162706 RepID=A0A6J4TSE4_9ACTN|nr:MAG: hypothetical protein AVDCRST_MAG67-4139 [uncultured Solirubrobacteraceae bacterium]
MLAVFVLIFELVRRRRLMERYALLWLFSATVLLALALLQGLLESFARLVGVAYAPSALFAVALGCGLLLMLHFSLVISRLTDQTKLLAQGLGRVQQQLDELQATHADERSRLDAERDRSLVGD